MTIWIVSFSHDLHALAIHGRFRKKLPSGQAIFLPLDKICRAGTDHFLTVEDGRISYVTGSEQTDFHAGDVVWSRRSNPFGFPFLLSDEHDEAQYIASALSYLLEYLYHHVEGLIWVNDRSSAARIENKLVQLDLARQVGLTTPRTVLTNDLQSVPNGMPLVMKSLGRVPGRMLATLPFEENVTCQQLSATLPLVQELIIGDRHLRVAIFGDHVIAASYRSSDVDSRPDHLQKMDHIELPKVLKERSQKFLEVAGLHMGVFDFRGANLEEMYFLECNQQGQFLYLEPKLKVDVTNQFCEYLFSLHDK